MTRKHSRDRDDEYGGPSSTGIDDYGRPVGGRARADTGRYGTGGGNHEGSGWPGRRTLTQDLAPRAADAVIPRMESAFGRSFAGVSVRTDDEAADKADRMGARAWAEGDEVGFARGEFAPDTRQGLHTIAHEFAHVAQGRGGSARAKARGGADHDDTVEAEADAAADAVVAGERPEIEEVALGLRGKRRDEKAVEIPPPGSVRVERAGKTLVLTFPGADVRKWVGDPRVEPLLRAGQTMYPGLTRDHLVRFIDNEMRGVAWRRGAFDPAKWRQPILKVEIEPPLMAGLTRWVEAYHPELGSGPIRPGADPSQQLPGSPPAPPAADSEQRGQIDPERFPPKATLEVSPKLGPYVAGGTVQLEVEHDMSEPQYKRWLLLVSGHASYHWGIRRAGNQGARSLTTFRPYDYFSDDRKFKMPVPEEPGVYFVEVELLSRHFTEAATLRHIIVAVREGELDRQAFEQTLAAAGNPFERDVDGKLSANPDAQLPTPEAEQMRLSVQQGMANRLRGQGAIDDRDHAAFTRQQTKKIAAQEKIAKANAGHEPYLIHGSFLSRDSGQSMPLSLVMYGQTGDGFGLDGGGATYSLTVHDSTLDGTRPAQHRGSGNSFKRDLDGALVQAEQRALKDLRDRWHKHNDYPNGTIHLAIQLHEGDRPVHEFTIDTDSWQRTGRDALGTIANVAGLALLVLPGGGVLSASLLIISGVAGTAETILALKHRAETQGGLHADSALALDLLNIATNFAGAGGLSKTIHYGSGLVRGMYYGTMIGLTGAQGYLIAQHTQSAMAGLEAEYAVQIAMAPAERKAELRKQRDHAVARLMGDAIISGGFLLVSLTGVLKEASVKGEMRRFVQELGARGSLAELENLLRNHENGSVRLTPAELAHIEAMLAGARTTGTAGNRGNAALPKGPPGEPPATKPGEIAGSDPVTPAQSPDSSPSPILSVGGVVDPAIQHVRVGHSLKTRTEALSVLEGLSAGKRDVLQKVGVGQLPDAFDPRMIEWGVGKLPDGQYVVVKGAPGEVRWGPAGSIQTVAHSHPLRDGGALPTGGVSLREIAMGQSNLKPPLLGLFPSGADIATVVAHGAHEHTLALPYASLGGDRVGNPGPAGTTDRPRVAMHIADIADVGSWGANQSVRVYKSKVTARAGKDVLWAGDVYTVAVPGIGDLVSFVPPEMLRRSDPASSPARGEPSSREPSSTGPKPPSPESAPAATTTAPTAPTTEAPWVPASGEFVRVAEYTDGVLLLTASVGDKELSIIANAEKRGSELTFKETHIEGAAANEIGVAGLRRVINDFGRANKVSVIIVEGGRRTTGPVIGRRPRMTFRIQ